jgi:hypothetical protein
MGDGSPMRGGGGITPTGFALGFYWNTQDNHGYNRAPVNDHNFIGWTNYFNAINAVLAQAHGRVSVYGFEIAQELNLAVFTAQARYFYDNSSPLTAPSQYIQTIPGPDKDKPLIPVANILQALRDLMTANGFDPGRVEYSVPWWDANTATQNCLNAYGDYARATLLDAMTQTINGGPIGMPSGQSTALYSIPCGGTLDGMFTSPIYSTQPNIVDVHLYPQVAETPNTDAMIQQAAAIDYGDIPHFLAVAGLQSATIVIGETWPGTMSPLNIGTQGHPNYCPGGTYPWPAGAPSDNVAGFNNEGVPDPLSNYTVTFRPWMNLQIPSGQCYAYGSGPGTPGNYQTINYNGRGPYTPTHR